MNSRDQSRRGEGHSDHSIEAIAQDETIDPRRCFDDPMVVVDDAHASYHDRLGVLQRWRSLAIGDSAGIDQVDAALKALQARAMTDDDDPTDGLAWGYGRPKS